jgi:AcrR family transcriptional regulator
MGETEHRGRGRPREVTRTPPGTGPPIELRLADMAPTSRAILTAAREVSLAAGVAGLTLPAVARQAHVDLSTVKYHFGSKAGLLEALLDSLYRDDVARFVAAAARLDTVEARLDAYFEMATRDMMEGRERNRVYYELECLALRDPLLARRFATHNAWFMEAMLRVLFGPERAAAEVLVPAKVAFWALFAAVIDGMGLQHAFDPEGYPLTEVMDLLRKLARGAVAGPTEG